MTHYLLPRTYLYTYKQLQYTPCKSGESPPLFISQSLAHYLYGIKEKIDEHDKLWDIYKKYTNPYEYIHTSIPFKKKCIAKHKPLSRSYFKMLEICNIFALLDEYDVNKIPIKTFHLAEGPGGFIEAIARMRNHTDDIYVGMTLQDSDPNVPAWKKTTDFLTEFPNVKIENGADGTGNILSIDNYDYIVENYGDIDIITADGGFDFSMDFNQQETFIAKLLYAQTAYALSIQKQKGVFVLKTFDIFMRHTVDILYLLSSFYEEVYIVKPQTSRYANSEKYIVCIGFLFDRNTEKDYLQYLRKTMEDMLANECNSFSFIRDVPSYLFLQKMEEYNAIFGQKQMQNIYNTMILMESKHKYDKIDTLIKMNVKKCIEWCVKYNVPYIFTSISKNIFVQNSFLQNSNNTLGATGTGTANDTSTPDDK